MRRSCLHRLIHGISTNNTRVGSGLRNVLGMWCRRRQGHVCRGKTWFQKICDLKGGDGLSLGSMVEGKVVLIKLGMLGDINSRGGGVKATKPFMRGIVTHKDARNTMRGKFVSHVIT